MVSLVVFGTLTLLSTSLGAVLYGSDDTLTTVQSSTRVLTVAKRTAQARQADAATTSSSKLPQPTEISSSTVAGVVSSSDPCQGQPIANFVPVGPSSVLSAVSSLIGTCTPSTTNLQSTPAIVPLIGASATGQVPSTTLTTQTVSSVSPVTGTTLAGQNTAPSAGSSAPGTISSVLSGSSSTSSTTTSVTDPSTSSTHATPEITSQPVSSALASSVETSQVDNIQTSSASASSSPDVTTVTATPTPNKGTPVAFTTDNPRDLNSGPTPTIVCRWHKAGDDPTFRVSGSGMTQDDYSALFPSPPPSPPGGPDIEPLLILATMQKGILGELFWKRAGQICIQPDCARREPGGPEGWAFYFNPQNKKRKLIEEVLRDWKFKDPKNHNNFQGCQCDANYCNDDV